jgi:ribosomal protein S18 acetylase RimI-like enzyme
MDVVVRPAVRDDVDYLAAMLGRAFADDPLWDWIYPTTDRVRRLTTMFDALLRVVLARGATVLTDEHRRGAAIWQRSSERRLGFTGNARMGVAMMRGRARLRRGVEVMRELERRHPAEAYWYLATLGTDPAHQGTGVGTALVRHVLDDPASAAEGAYLETETTANVSYYTRLGFEVLDELDVPRGGPHLWTMWRDPPTPA